MKDSMASMILKKKKKKKGRRKKAVWCKQDVSAVIEQEVTAGQIDQGIKVTFLRQGETLGLIYRAG